MCTSRSSPPHTVCVLFTCSWETRNRGRKRSQIQLGVSQPCLPGRLQMCPEPGHYAIVYAVRSRPRSVRTMVEYLRDSPGRPFEVSRRASYSREYCAICSLSLRFVLEHDVILSVFSWTLPGVQKGLRYASRDASVCGVYSPLTG